MTTEIREHTRHPASDRQFLYVVPSATATDRSGEWGSIDPSTYFGFPDQFDVTEVKSILHTEVRTHDSDGTPLSVYFGPTRVRLLADIAIDLYGQEHAEAIQKMADIVTEDYMTKF